MIIGLCGAAGAGKDTVAARLAAAHGFEAFAFADPLYKMISEMTGLPVEHLRDREVKERVLPAVGMSPRKLLQSLGTEWGRSMVSDDIWIKLALQRAAGSLNATISDVRFDNEAEAVRRAGGRIWRVVRPGVSCLDASTARHSSEQGISPDLIDLVLLNDAGIETLDARVDAAIAL